MDTYIEVLTRFCNRNSRVIKGGNGWPKEISSDQEFNRAAIINLFQNHGATKFFFSSPGQLHKNPIVERVHKTLALRLNRYRQANHNYAWNKYLPEIVDAYNKSFHSTIQAKPIDVFTGVDHNYQTPVEVEPEFKEGDRVRYRLDKKQFGKSDRFMYSKDIYVIHTKEGKRFKLVKLTDPTEFAPRTYPGYELQRAEDAELNAEVPENEEQVIANRNRRGERARKEAAEGEEVAARLRPARAQREIRLPERFRQT